ncbi:ABC transporter permease [candidate division KSB1 bacterium]|nr:ABC transporter permease [candidate division KSB1 bacterium]
MNNFFEIVRQTLFHLRQYKARTFMTVFGITWGTVTVILLLAFGTGLGRKLLKDMHGMGEGIAIVWPGRSSMPYKGYNRDRPVRLTDEDVELVRHKVPGLAHISPEYSKWGVPVRYGKKINSPNITGIIPEYAIMRNISPQPGGRWLNELDIQKRRRVVFLGNRLKDYLFGENVDAIGQYVYLGENPFLIVGVLIPKTQDSSYNQRDQDRVFIPSTTFVSIYGYKYISNIVYQHKNPHQAKQNEKQVYLTLAQKYTYHPDDKETLGIWDTCESEQFMQDFGTSFNLFMAIIGAISLLIGGIGLANIMYIIVQERTTEIGIRRSVGAKKRHIMTTFFLETFLIIGFSGGLGFLLASAVISLMNQFPIEEYVGRPVMSISVVIITVSVIGFIGFMAGYFPARKAANLDPVECIRA